MKRMLFFITLAATLCLVLMGCETTDIRGENPEKIAIIELPGLQKDEIFNRVNIWMVRNFVKADSVIEYSNKDSGTLSGKFVLDNWDICDYTGIDPDVFMLGRIKMVRSIIIIECKDEKVRFTCRLIGKCDSPFLSDGYSWRQASREDVKKIHFKQICSHLAGMLKGYIVRFNGDW